MCPTVALSDSVNLCPHSHRTSKSNPDPRPHWKHTESISACLSFTVSSCISSKGKPFTVTVCLKPRDVESNGNPYPLFVAFCRDASLNNRKSCEVGAHDEGSKLPFGFWSAAEGTMRASSPRRTWDVRWQPRQIRYINILMRYPCIAKYIVTYLLFI